MRVVGLFIVALGCVYGSVAVAAPQPSTRRVAAEELEPLARAAISAKLSAGIELKSVHLPALVNMGAGELQVALAAPLPLRPGRHSVALLVSVGSERPVHLAAIAEITSSHVAGSAIARGTNVRIVVRLPGIVVSTRGTAQASVLVGEVVQVLADGGRKVLTGRLVDGETVEVVP